MSWHSPEAREQESLAVKSRENVQSISEKNRTPRNKPLQEQDPVCWGLCQHTDAWPSLASRTVEVTSFGSS